MRKLIIPVSAIILIFCILSGCKNNPKQIENKDLSKLNWMLGNWSGLAGESLVTERWVKINDSLFSGESYFIKGSDTLSRESISIQLQATAVLYIPLVEGQNNNEPVFFRMTFADSKNAVFENQEHDFPQKISYQFNGGDSLIASVSGINKGIRQNIRFPMKRNK